MTYTNSFHHGTERVPGHNNRTLQGEAHIDPNGKYEVWKDEKLADAYDRIFGEALQEYNTKQKRADRKIKSYLQNVRQNSKLNDCYEFIAQVGNEKSHPEEEVCHDILKAYYDEFAERNPGLEVIGGYYHADEVGGCPHLHVDYIPIAPNKKTGLKIKNNLSEALKRLGYETEYIEDKERGVNKKTGKPYTRMVSAEMKFQEAERKALTRISRAYGIEIENPNRPAEEYCSSKQLREARDIRIQNEARENALQTLTEALETRQTALDNKEHQLDVKEQNLSNREAEVERKGEVLSDYMQHAKENSFEVLQECEQTRKNKFHIPWDLPKFMQKVYDSIRGAWALVKKLTDKNQKLEKDLKDSNKRLENWRNTDYETLENLASEMRQNGVKTWNELEAKKNRHQKLKDVGLSWSD